MFSGLVDEVEDEGAFCEAVGRIASAATKAAGGPGLDLAFIDSAEGPVDDEIGAGAFFKGFGGELRANGGVDAVLDDGGIEIGAFGGDVASTERVCAEAGEVYLFVEVDVAVVGRERRSAEGEKDREEVARHFAHSIAGDNTESWRQKLMR